jgi:DNA-binding NarL/FixJ family response regulator
MRSVLVVEDEALIALDLACSLEALGYKVLGPASSGEDALRIAEQESPDLLLMDVTIKGAADGIDTAMAITAEHPAKVVFLTAHSDPGTRRRASLLNPAAFLQKPWTARQVQQVLTAAFATA